MKEKQLAFGYFFDSIYTFNDFEFEGRIGDLDFYFFKESNDWYVSLYSSQAETTFIQEYLNVDTMKECMDFCVKEAELNLLEFKEILDNF